MTTETRLAVISLVVIIIGGIFTLFGTMLIFTQANTSQTKSNHISTAPVGFVFGTSENLTQDITDFRVTLNDISCRQQTVKAEVTLNVGFQESAYVHNETYAFFLLQVPYKISDVTVGYLARDPQLYGGSYRAFNNGYDDVSAILIEIPRKTGNFSISKTVNFAFNFRITNVFSIINPYTYEMDVTFCSNFHESITNANGFSNLASFSYYKTVFYQLNMSELVVEQPNKSYIFSQIMPISNGIHYHSGYRSYSWDVKALSTRIGSDSVILTLEDIDIKDIIIRRESLSLFSLGLGIPLFISSLFELLRNHNLREIKNERKIVGVSLTLIIVISIILFSIVFSYIGL